MLDAVFIGAAVVAFIVAGVAVLFARKKLPTWLSVVLPVGSALIAGVSASMDVMNIRTVLMGRGLDADQIAACEDISPLSAAEQEAIRTLVLSGRTSFEQVQAFACHLALEIAAPNVGAATLTSTVSAAARLASSPEAAQREAVVAVSQAATRTDGFRQLESLAADASDYVALGDLASAAEPRRAARAYRTALAMEPSRADAQGGIARLGEAAQHDETQTIELPGSSFSEAPQTLVLLLATAAEEENGQVTRWTWTPYCTPRHAMLGLQYDPAQPDKVEVVLLTSGADGRLGDGCQGTGNTGRLKFADIPLAGRVLPEEFTVTARFYANVSGCAYDGSADANGNAERVVSLRIRRNEHAFSYTRDPQLLRSFADLDGRAAVGRFAVCESLQSPGYMVMADKRVWIT